MEDSLRFRSMLIKLDHLIRNEELKILTFACKNDIPTRRREKITSSIELFGVLEEFGKLSESNVIYLKSILNVAFNGRTDVIKIVEEYEQGEVASPEIDASSRLPGQQSQVFHQECQYLEDNLGSKHLSFLRRLGVKDQDIENIQHDHPRNIKEVIHQCLGIWLRDNRHLQHSELLSAVINALKKEHRNDLANHLEAGTFS